MSAQVSAFALQRAILRRAVSDGLFREPPRSARLALEESRYADVLRQMRQLARTRDPESRTRESDMPLGVVGVPMPVAPEPLS